MCRWLGLIAVACISFSSFAEDAKPTFEPAGMWEGSLDAGAMKMRLAFKIEKNADGTLKGTWDSVDQGAKGMPIGSVKFEGGELKFDFPKSGASFTGKPSDDGKIVTGKWKQSGHELPLEIKRVDKLTELRRPQNPVKPYPYIEEEVTIENTAAKDVKLAGTLTLPKGNGPFPAVVLITGSGQQDRDETLLSHKPFLVLADHLTKQGIAVLRCDDRGTGKSTGNHATSTSADFATDTYACVKFLQSRKEIDGKRIGLAGHSEGGMIAPMVAAEHPEEVGFVILLAGPGLPGDQILIDQSRVLLKAMKVEEKKAALMGRLQMTLMKAACESAEDAKLSQCITSFIEGLTGDERKLLDADDEKVIRSSYKMLTAPWFQYFIHYDPRPNLRKVRCPLLAINGELDLQVTPKENLQAIAATMKEAGNKDVTTKEFAGLNHLFQHSKTGLPTEYGEIEETLSPDALDVIAQWILKRKP